MSPCCAATTLTGARCRNPVLRDGLCGTHHSLRLRRMAAQPALGALSGPQRALAALRSARPQTGAQEAFGAQQGPPGPDTWTLTFHADGWVDVDATTDDPARLEARLAAFLEYVAELGPAVLHCLSGHCGATRHAA